VESLEKGEVSAPSEQSAVEESTQPDGNLSMAQYATQLLERRESREEEPDGEPEEALESAGEESADEGDPLAEAMQEEAPDEPEPPAGETEPKTQPTGHNVDLDSLSEEETTALAKQLNASAVKRFGKLTAQKKTLAERNLALERRIREQDAQT
ncbi:uncharacterized protein METZ01_LOCUS203829, partial [marine metagenome]